jgi:hypothetical protein
MSDTFNVLEAGIQALFPHVKAMRISASMELGAIPEWDGVAAAGLQAFIALRFGVHIPGAHLREGTTIGELIGYIRRTGAPGESCAAAAGARAAGRSRMPASQVEAQTPEPTISKRS